MFISDLPRVALPGNTIASCADDCKSSRIVDPDEDLKLLRQDLENLEKWSTLNGLAQMDNYENGSPMKQKTIHLNFLLEQH